MAPGRRQQRSGVPRQAARPCPESSASLAAGRTSPPCDGQNASSRVRNRRLLHTLSMVTPSRRGLRSNPLSDGAPAVTNQDLRGHHRRERQGLHPLRRPLAARSRLRPHQPLSRKTRPSRRPAAPTRASHTGAGAMTGPTSLRPRCAHRRAAPRPHGARQTPTALRRPTPGRPPVSRKLGIPRRGPNFTALRRTKRLFARP